MTIRGIQRGQQVVPGVQPNDASADAPAQSPDSAVTDFSALLSQMAAQVGMGAADGAGSALIKTLNATAAARQDAKAAEPARPRPERDRADRSDAPARAVDKSSRRDDRVSGQDDDRASAAEPVETAPQTDPSTANAAATQATVQAAVASMVAVEAAPVAVSDAAGVSAQPDQAAVAAVASVQAQTVAPETRAAGQAQAGAGQAGATQQGTDGTQTAQAVQAVTDGQQQDQSGLMDDGAARQDQSAARPQVSEHQAKAAKTALTETQAATNADTATATAKAADGPLTTVNAEQSKGLAKAIGDDRPVSVQVQVDGAAQQAATQDAAPVDDGSGPSTWYDLAKQGPQAPSNGAATPAKAADAAQQQTQPLTGLGAVAAATLPGGAANSAATQGGVDGIDAVKGVSGPSGTAQTGQTSPTSAPAAATSAQQQAGQAAKAQHAKAPPRAQPQPEHPDPIDQIRVRIQQDATKGETIKIALRPDTLGRVEVKLDIREGKVNAQVVAETSEALEMMKTDARGLEKALNDAGLRADPGSVTFSLKDGGAQQQMAQQDQGQPDRQGAGTPYDRVGHSLEDDLAPELGTIDALRSAQAAARGGVDVRI